MRDDPYLEPASTRPVAFKRISWGAIFAGLVIILVSQLTLTLLGIAIGATTVDILQNPEGLGIGAAIWLGVTTLISVYLGACVAGRLSGGPRRADGMLHGVVTWGVTTLVTLTLLTSALGNLIGGTAGLLTQAASSVGQGAPGINNSDQPGEQGLAAQAMNNPELLKAVTQMLAKGGPQAAPEEREKVVSLLSQNGMSRAEASRMVDQISMSGEKAKELGQKTARGVSWTAWVSFGVLALSALVAALGGITGVRRLQRQRSETTPPP